MANIEIIDTIVPKNGQEFPVVDSNNVKGGHHSVADTTARDAIDSRNRTEGMVVYSIADAKSYRLEGGITNSDWVEEYTENYVHTQGSSSATWSITHNLGRDPSVMIYDSNNKEIIGQVEINVTNVSITISFNKSYSGKAFLS